MIWKVDPGLVRYGCPNIGLASAAYLFSRVETQYANGYPSSSHHCTPGKQGPDFSCYSRT